MKVSLFTWTAAWGKILTVDNLRKRNIVILDRCSTCNNSSLLGCAKDGDSDVLLLAIRTMLVGESYFPRTTKSTGKEERCFRGKEHLLSKIHSL